MRFLAITSMKNEGAFVLEWLAHLRTVGFTDLLVFSNDCADGTDAMLDRLQAMGALTHIRQSGPFEEGPQWSALKQADRHPLRKAADWVMFLDIDEFPVIHVGDGTLSALVEALPEADAIPLTWRLFGNNGVVAFEDRPITTQFTRAAPAVMRWPWRAQMFKTLFRSSADYRKLGVHRPRSLAPDAAPRWFDGSGRELPDLFRANRLFSLLGEENYRLAQLNHYPLGAMESYVVKCDRGRANRAAGAFDMSYWVERNFSTAEDRSIDRYAAQMGSLRQQFLADPELARLHAGAVAWRKARFEALMAEEAYRALFGRLMLTPASEPLSEAAEARMVALGRRAQGAAGETI
ncbi:glycosyltransferase family 2 protein [Pseudothioclava nitratireducens]|uniref:glycosyltransferase family 2 protein n=1 Tax=Pseudothioclava nitratireducens TaxID=1928646 RepID=UPI0023DA866B|nr:glycosyltransferase family 2 protein [Defluviimonas nitratireducens]MDF1619992.1 glycosyltransferase family 2 protein [Defluviimonas nitratireducens]